MLLMEGLERFKSVYLPKIDTGEATHESKYFAILQRTNA